ncbi:hypothetical protein ACFW04_004383 [Cataglyphis niger]
MKLHPLPAIPRNANLFCRGWYAFHHKISHAGGIAYTAMIIHSDEWLLCLVEGNVRWPSSRGTTSLPLYEETSRGMVRRNGGRYKNNYTRRPRIFMRDSKPQITPTRKSPFTFTYFKTIVARTPINRLPIMAKSVLDLFELYKLVVMRGGLVEVINKKLWQEIIKGLRLPASITSAAFTLRTQYMKYLYPYEQQKENLSTQEQLQTAIETNRRESRRSNYTTYATNNDSMVARSQHNSLPPNPLPLSMPLSMAQMELHRSQSPFVNGHPQHVTPNLGSNISEYMMKMLRDRSNSITNNSIIPQQTGNTSISPPTTEALSAIELSKLTLWNLYQNNNKIYSVGQQSFPPSTSHSPLGPATSPEPQREALDLANSAHRSDPVSPPSASRSVSSPPAGMKRDQDAADLSPAASNKRIFSDEENIPDRNSMRITQMVTMRENGRRELAISVDIDGVLYEGVLPAKNDDASSTSSISNTIKRPRNS